MKEEFCRVEEKSAPNVQQKPSNLLSALNTAPYGYSSATNFPYKALYVNDQFKLPCLSTEAGIDSSPEASCSLPSEHLKHFHREKSSAPTRGAAETSQAGKKQNRLCFWGKGQRSCKRGDQQRTKFFPIIF